MTSRIGKIALDKTLFLCCDVQDRFRSLIHNFPSVLYVAHTMNKASQALKIPLVVTEQYPKVFGNTCKEIELDPNQKVFAKKKFSMMDEPVLQYMEQEELFKGRKQAVLYGIEAHVCVLQTALDLMERDYEVHIVADGVSSQRKFDRDVAFDRLKQIGAYLTTSESLLFQLVQSADHEKFKDISALVTPKSAFPRPDPGSFH